MIPRVAEYEKLESQKEGLHICEFWKNTAMIYAVMMDIYVLYDTYKDE